MADPTLKLHDASGAVIAKNDNWSASADKQAIIDSGIAPGDEREAAIVATLKPAPYTAVVRGAVAGTGVALTEIYDLAPSAGRLANISTRGEVGTADRVMIGGFIIGGDAPTRVLVRAIGPSLAKAVPPVLEALADPQLELRDADGNLMASNDNWSQSPQAAAIQSTGLAPSEPAEAAILAPVDPGNYTAIVRGNADGKGIGLVEVYRLP